MSPKRPADKGELAPKKLPITKVGVLIRGQLSTSALLPIDLTRDDSDGTPNTTRSVKEEEDGPSRHGRLTLTLVVTRARSDQGWEKYGIMSVDLD